MGKITAARAYANNEVTFIAWDIDGMISGCLGFDIVRIRVDGSEDPKGLPAWVPFEGQRNSSWSPQDTGVWPVQKLYWRDLTLRKHRADTGRREIGFEVKYSVRPVGDMAPGLEPVPARQPVAYTGPVRPLGYLGDAEETNVVKIDLDYDGVRATFTNGILSGQWLQHAIESAGKTFDAPTIRTEIADPKSPIRSYLTGDVLETVGLFLTDDKYRNGTLRLALYELGDDELVQLLIANKKRIEVILSNSSKARGGTTWDAGNQPNRKALKAAGVTVHNRMFNNSHIGHNKFAVWLDSQDIPRAVMSGSTNWTSTGLCGQSNNALVVTSDDVAKSYGEYWQRLVDDGFPTPKPPTSAGKAAQKQGPEIREADQAPTQAKLNRATALEIWYSPNTTAVRKGKDVPPDLAVLFDLMSKAQQAIFFLAFLPSRAGADSIISAAIAAGAAGEKLIVAGAISDVTAMPGYVPGDKNTGEKGVTPYVYDSGSVHIVRAAALNDVVGDFEKELLKVGNAIVHDKIVVIDPLSDDCVVATGSHNLGFKASYENDENLLIFRGNQLLAQAYAVHVLDVYDHYRFRAWQAKERDEGKPLFEGNLVGDDKWLRGYASKKKGDISRYFASLPGR